MFNRLGKFVVRHWLAVIVCWALFVGLVYWLAPNWDDVTRDGDLAFLPPQMPSVRGEQLLSDAFPRDRVKSEIAVYVGRDEGALQGDELAVAYDLARQFKNLQGVAALSACPAGIGQGGATAAGWPERSRNGGGEPCGESVAAGRGRAGRSDSRGRSAPGLLEEEGRGRKKEDAASGHDSTPRSLGGGVPQSFAGVPAAGQAERSERRRSDGARAGRDVPGPWHGAFSGTRDEAAAAGRVDLAGRGFRREVKEIGGTGNPPALVQRIHGGGQHRSAGLPGDDSRWGAGDAAGRLAADR